MADRMDRTGIDAARVALEQAQEARLARQRELAAHAEKVKRLERVSPPESTELAVARRAQLAAASQLADARAGEREARSSLSGAINAWLPPDPVAAVERLDAAYPIVLFPARLETRFFPAEKELRLRVYPDEILADGHEPELTGDERADGLGYWQRPEGRSEADAWRQLAVKYRPPRAAWIVLATSPDGPKPGSRPSSWSRAVVARLLPDRWVALAYRGGIERARAVGNVVPEPLPLTLGPDTPLAERVGVGGGGELTVDDALAWTVDFDRALADGMALKLSLTDDDLHLGFDRVVVLGVKPSRSAESNVAALTALFEAHHYHTGLAFVPQGTPTSNGDAAAGYPLPDPNAEASFRTERGERLDIEGGDGQRFAAALGLPADVVAHVTGADGREQERARAMNRALFPATLGYFLEQMMDPVVDRDGVEQARRHFVEHLRGRGPLPAFRVGRVPYGVLPVSSLSRWAPAPNASGIDVELPDLLRLLRRTWSEAAKQAPHVGRSSDPDADLLDILSMDASARSVRLRRVLGESAQWNLMQMLGLAWEEWAAAQRLIAHQLLVQLGHPEWDPRVLHGSFAAQAVRFAGPFVTERPLSERDPLDPNYIEWLCTASVDDLQKEAAPFGSPTALLYKLLRHAMLLELHGAAMSILREQRLAGARDHREAELVGIVAGDARRTAWQQFARVVPSVTGRATLGQYLTSSSPSLPEPVLAYRDALATLAVAPTAELERLCTETLDLSSHRLDAWVTSLAWKRLQEMRRTHARGSHVGVYAWVEDVRPAASSTVTLADGRTARTTAGGYVHTPSMLHAATAAVLRNGFLTHAQSPDSPYAVDLSSARVRAARFVLDAVQAGQPLGAVFGYQLERGLHDRQVEVLIDPLRRLYPLVANKAFDAGEPAESIAARNVVDGLLLHTAWRDGQLPFGGNSGLPASGPARAALEAELRALDDAVDAVADLLMAESVHQLVRGSTSAAAASLDALARGGRPPDIEVARTPSGGLVFTHRVALIVGEGTLPLGDGWPTQPTARAAAEPRLDAWVGSLLGDPRHVQCRVRWPAPKAGDPEREKLVTLAELALRPLDVLALARSVLTDAAASELDRRVLHAAFGDPLQADGAPLDESTPLTVVYSAAEGWDRMQVRTFPELLDLAQAISATVGGARLLRADDLIPPESAATVTAAPLGGEAMARVRAARTALQTAHDDLDQVLQAAKAQPDAATLKSVRDRLRAAAAFGVAAAFPRAGAGAEEGTVAPSLQVQAASVLDELADRLARVYDPGNADEETLAAAASAMAAAVFGSDFLLVTGFQPPNASELAQALAYGPTLVRDQRAPERWLQQVMRVRPAFARWRKMQLFSRAMNAPPMPLAVAQLPHVGGASWMALPPDQGEERLPGRISLALHRPVAPTASNPWFGVVVDEWPEVIPSATEHTGLAFHYHDAGGEAPQAVLIAVPPTLDAEKWSFDALVDTLRETLDLAKLRAVDLRLLGELGQLLPGNYLASNAENAAISTRFTGSLIAETQVLGQEDG